METACLRHTEIPGASRLFLDFLYSFEQVKEFYPAPAFDLSSYQHAARAIDFPDLRRSALVAALAEINPASPLLSVLAQPDTVVVATGQQNGLYGGPAYSIYKALTAVAIARQLTAAGRAAVPVFWVATEDHDFAEVNHTWVFNGRMEPQRLQAGGIVQPQQPVGGVALKDLPLEALRSALEDLPYGPDVLTMANSAYVPGRTYGEAFRELMRQMLGPEYPVLFLDPLRPSIRRLAQPFLAEAARASDELTALVAAQGQRLSAAGYHAQVLVDAKNGSLFFSLASELDGDGSDPRLRRTSLKRPEVAAYQDQPEKLSPNALLRPVMQDYLMPVAVMVGGAAEIAYLAQSAPLYERLLGRQSVPVPRAGFTLLDARATKLLDRTGLRVPEVLAPGDAVRQKIATRLTPPAVQRVFRETAGEIDASLNRWRSTLGTFDATLAAALDKSRTKIEYQLQKTAAKVAREALRRDERAAADAEALVNRIYPHRHLQERLYSLLPFLAAHGPSLIGRIYENIHVDCPDHHLMAV